MKKKFFILLILLSMSAVLLTLSANLPSGLMYSFQTEIEKRPELPKKATYAILIDYKRSLLRKRLWLIEIKTGQVILNSHVSHAWKSGFLYARKFSNQSGSELSCKGTFITLGTYKSKFGTGTNKVGMQIRGLEKGINDKTLERDIVFHSYWLPFWSKGCFMTFPRINKKIAELTANGNIVFVRD